MLIRSQDKEILIDFGNTSAIEITGASVVTTRNNVGWCCILGRYSNNEKCLKVLDMIQEAYADFESAKITSTGLATAAYTGSYDAKESVAHGIAVLKGYGNEIRKSILFQMPADNEVEV